MTRDGAALPRISPATIEEIKRATSRLSPEAIAELRGLAKDHPIVAGEGLELAADLQRAESDRGLVPANTEVLALYRDSVRLRLETEVAGSYQLAAAALKAAETARFLGDDEAMLEALRWALACTEDAFPTRMAREALAQHFCQKGQYAEALAQLGPIGRVGWLDAGFVAGLLLASDRPAEAAALWADLPDWYRSRDVFSKVWALHRAGDKKNAKRVLSAARKVKEYLVVESFEVEAKALSRFLSGRTTTLPEGYHQVFGPLADPRGRVANLAVFVGVRAHQAAALAAKLHRLVHGSDLALAELLVSEAALRKTAGEPHERALFVPRMQEAIAILDREKGANDPGTLTHLEALYSASGGAVQLACAERYLAMTPPPDFTAVAMAQKVADHRATTDLPQAIALARVWLDRTLGVEKSAWQLAQALARLERRRGIHAAEVEALRQAIGFFDPEDWSAETKLFELKTELARARRSAGAPDVALEAELAAARAAWAAAWTKGRGAGKKQALALLEPYLQPEGRYGGAPFEAIDAAGNALGWRFLKAQVNARPAHGELIEACRPHASITTFSGYAAEAVTIESLETRDTPEIRERLGSSADDVLPRDDGRLYLWWD